LPEACPETAAQPSTEAVEISSVMADRATPLAAGLSKWLLFVVLLLTAISGFAATQGPLNPATCANDASVGNKAWSPVTLPASVALNASQNDQSNYLKCTGYGFTIPAGSVIDGITVTVNRSENRAGVVQDAAMRIVKNGAIGVTDKSNAAFWPTAAASVNYGSAADLWGNTWTVADINAATFGAAISAIASNGNGNTTLIVSSITITVTYHAIAAPTVAKSFTPTTIPSQGTSTLTITLSNSNATAITGTAFNDAYPAGLVNAPTPAGSTTCAGGTVTAAAGGGSVALSGGTIPASGSCTVTVTVTSSTAGSYANNVPVGAVTSTNAPANTVVSNTATLTVLNRPVVAKQFSPNPIVTGQNSTLTITLTNTNAVAITGVAFTDTYPAGVTNASTASTTCPGGTATATVGGGAVALSAGTILASSSCTVTVTVTAASAGSYANSIAVGAVTSANAGTNLLAASDTLTVNAAVVSFDAVEVGAAPHTNLFLKLSGVAFSVDILALNSSNLVSAAYTGTVTLTLVDASSSGTCALMTSLQALGTQTFAAGNAGRKTVSITYANAARNARIRISDAGLGITTCSFDAFSIRPTALTVTSNMTNTATTGAPAVAAGGNFTLTATAIAGYNGTPTIDNTKVAAHAGATQTGTIAGSFPAATAATGISQGIAFTYSEVGNFQFLAQGVADTTFTSIDQASDCTNDFSNTLVGGKYGCKVGNTASTAFFGRFTASSFTASGATLINRSAFVGCASTFTYMNEALSLGFLLTARNVAGVVTQNYTTASGFAQLDPTLPASFNFVARDGVAANMRTFVVSAITRANPGQVTTATANNFVTGDRVYITGVSGMTQANGQTVTVTVIDSTHFTIGINTSGYTAYTSGGTVSRLSGLSAAGTWIAGSANVTATARLERSVAPDGPYTSLSIGIAPKDADGVVLLSGQFDLDADANAVNESFTVGTTEERFGRLRLNNAFGSELLDLPLTLLTEYYAGSYFTTNALDSCTTLAASDFAFAYVAGFPLVACKTAMNPGTTVYFNAGTASAVAPPTAVSAVKLTKPGSGNPGSVDLTINLNGAGGNTCLAIGGVGPAATNANKQYLQSNWGSGSYTDNPRGRATFGIYKNADEFIYLRENF
jgi:uncharacterized repeat protein (TIGR01451 family)